MTALLAALVAFDLIRTLKTGRARSARNVTLTRSHQPERFWRYVYWSYVMLGLCLFVIVAAAAGWVG